MFGLSSLTRTLDAALRDLRHPKSDTRLSALRDLVRLAGTADRERAIGALAEVLRNDSEPYVSASAALALSDADAIEAIPELLAIAETGHVVVREMALAALGELCEPGAEDALRVCERARKDEAPSLRFQALLAQNRLARAALLEGLVDATRDADAEVRQIAYRLAEEHVTADRAELPEPLKQRARAALRDDAPHVRLAAALLLARVGENCGAAIISSVVRREVRVPSLEDEQAAIELAGELMLDDTRAALTRRAFGFFGLSRDPLAWHARVALARLGDEQAKTAILRGLRAFTRDARTIAVAAAGRARLREARSILHGMTPAHADPETVAEALAELEPLP